MSGADLAKDKEKADRTDEATVKASGPDKAGTEAARLPATTPSRSGTGSQLSNLPGKPASRTSRVWRTASARVTVSSQQSVGRSPTRLVSGANGTISSVAFASAGVSVT